MGRVLGMNQTEKRERTVLESAGKWGGGGGGVQVLGLESGLRNVSKTVEQNKSSF